MYERVQDGATPPCYQCKDRKACCHDKCERYAEFAKYREKVREQRQKERIFF